MSPSVFSGIVLGVLLIVIWGWYFWTERYDFEFFRKLHGGKWYLLRSDGSAPYWCPLEHIRWIEIYTIGNKQGRLKIIKEESWN